MCTGEFYKADFFIQYVEGQNCTDVRKDESEPNNI